MINTLNAITNDASVILGMANVLLGSFVSVFFTNSSTSISIPFITSCWVINTCRQHYRCNRKLMALAKETRNTLFLLFTIMVLFLLALLITLPTKRTIN